MHVDHENGQPAKTRYRVVERAGNRAAWVELEPMTGRTHQLRVHMAAMGNPIVGDGKYGGQDAFLTGSISRKMHLHARRLLIAQPEGGKLDVTAELPTHFAESMEQLGFDPSLSQAKPLREDVTERTPAEKKLAAKRHFKQARKEASAPRRARGGDAPKKKLGKKSVGKVAKKAGPAKAKGGPTKPKGASPKGKR
jgi:23S rRNA pseudouridine955/2504/2580 synthase